MHVHRCVESLEMTIGSLVSGHNQPVLDPVVFVDHFSANWPGIDVARVSGLLGKLHIARTSGITKIRSVRMGVPRHHAASSICGRNSLDHFLQPWSRID